MKLRALFGAALLAGTMSVAANASCIGACGTDGPNGDITAAPVGGGSYAYVTTSGGAGGGGYYPGAGGAAANASGVDDLGDPTTGSTLISDQFTSGAGGSLSFYFNFVTSDGTTGFPDFAWAALEDGSGNVLETLFTAQTTPPPGNTVPDPNLPANSATLTPPTSGVNLGTGGGGGPLWNELGSDSGSCYQGQTQGCGYTGWILSTYAITAGDVASSGGTFQLAFGVQNANDNLYNTGLAIAGEEIDTTPIGNGAVPEPSTILMLGGALLAMGFVARRRYVQQ